MNCNDIHENLIELLAGSPARSEVNEHVSQCETCARELEDLRKTMSLLDEWEAPEPSPYFLTRLHAHVNEERENSHKSLLSWLRRPVLAGSLAAVLVAGGVIYQALSPAVPSTGNAVGDLESLEKNHDLYVNSDLLDDIAGLNQQQDVAQ